MYQWIAAVIVAVCLVALLLYGDLKISYRRLDTKIPDSVTTLVNTIPIPMLLNIYDEASAGMSDIEKRDKAAQLIIFYCEHHFCLSVSRSQANFLAEYAVQMQKSLDKPEKQPGFQTTVPASC